MKMKNSLRKIGFFCSASCPPDILLKVYDFAFKIRDNKEIMLIGGFHDKIENDFLNFLINGRINIGVFLARDFYEKIPENHKKLFEEKRVEYFSEFKSSRISRKNCENRNIYIADMCEEFIIPYYKSGGITEKTVKYIESTGKKIYNAETMWKFIESK